MNIIKRLIQRIIVFFTTEKFRIKLYFLLMTKKRLNIKNPKTLSEKLQIRKLNYKENYSIMSDKVRVKDVLENKGFSEIVIPTIKVLNKLTLEDFENLPNEFAIKTNHGSGDVEIISDKSSVNKRRMIKKFNKLLKKSYSQFAVEKQYYFIKPKLIIEELLPLKDGVTPIDYKFHCFNNDNNWNYFLEIIEGRNTEIIRTHYDSDLNNLYTSARGDRYSNNNKFIPPMNFDKMLKIVKELSSDFGYIRVDLYNIDGEIFFGEFTFTPWGGCFNFSKKELDLKYGDLWTDYPN